MPQFCRLKLAQIERGRFEVYASFLGEGVVAIEAVIVEKIEMPFRQDRLGSFASEGGGCPKKRGDDGDAVSGKHFVTGKLSLEDCVCLAG